MADQEVSEVVEGDGYAVANLEALGDGPGFRKVRKELGVTAFGVNGIELPPTTTTIGRAPPSRTPSGSSAGWPEGL